MPLVYDDIPGSWGTYSQSWPFYRCRDEAHAQRAFVACTKENVVPYCSYVLCGLDLRVETHEMLDKLRKHLEASPIHDYREIIRMYENIELPVHCYDHPGIDMSMHLRKDAWEKLQQLRAERKQDVQEAP